SVDEDEGVEPAQDFVNLGEGVRVDEVLAVAGLVGGEDGEEVVALVPGVAGEGWALASLDGGGIFGGFLEQVHDAARAGCLLGARAEVASGFVGVPGHDVAAADPARGRADAVGAAGLSLAPLVVGNEDVLGFLERGLDERSLGLVLGGGLALASGAAALLGGFGAGVVLR